jgi:phosphocarrier protein
MIERHVIVGAKVGLHAPPAALFVGMVAEQTVKVSIAKPGTDPVDARSILSVLALDARNGDEVIISAGGDGAGPISSCCRIGRWPRSTVDGPTDRLSVCWKRRRRTSGSKRGGTRLSLLGGCDRSCTGEACQQSFRRGWESGDVAVRRATSMAASSPLTIIRAASLADPVNSSVPSFWHGLEPRLVLVEEPDHGVLHRLGESLVLGGRHAAEAHPPVAEHV